MKFAAGHGWPRDEHAGIGQLAGFFELKGCLYLSVDWLDIDAKAQVLANLVFEDHFSRKSVMFPLAKQVLLPGELLVLTTK
jgi:hypothetical protein